MRPRFIKPKNPEAHSSPLKAIKSFIPVAMWDRVNEESKKQGVRPSVLMMRALRNEFLADNPFHHPLPDISEVPYDIDRQNPYCAKLFVFINKFPGLGLDHLLFLKEEIGIPTERDVLLCLRDLTSSSAPQIEAYIPLSHIGQPVKSEAFRAHREMKDMEKKAKMSERHSKFKSFKDETEGVL